MVGVWITSAAVVEDEPVTEKRRWWLIPLGWLEDESFYKTSRRGRWPPVSWLPLLTFSRGAGYVSTPTGSQAAKGLLNVVGSVALAASAAWAGWFLHGKADESPHRETIEHVIKFALLFAALVVILLVTDARVYPIPFWPFGTPLFTY